MDVFAAIGMFMFLMVFGMLFLLAWIIAPMVWKDWRAGKYKSRKPMAERGNGER